MIVFSALKKMIVTIIYQFLMTAFTSQVEYDEHIFNVGIIPPLRKYAQTIATLFEPPEVCRTVDRMIQILDINQKSPHAFCLGRSAYVAFGFENIPLEKEWRVIGKYLAGSSAVNGTDYIAVTTDYPGLVYEFVDGVIVESRGFVQKLVYKGDRYDYKILVKPRTFIRHLLAMEGETAYCNTIIFATAVQRSYTELIQRFNRDGLQT